MFGQAVWGTSLGSTEIKKYKQRTGSKPKIYKTKFPLETTQNMDQTKTEVLLGSNTKTWETYVGEKVWGRTLGKKHNKDKLKMDRKNP